MDKKPEVNKKFDLPKGLGIAKKFSAKKVFGSHLAKASDIVKKCLEFAKNLPKRAFEVLKGIRKLDVKKGFASLKNIKKFDIKKGRAFLDERLKDEKFRKRLIAACVVIAALFLLKGIFIKPAKPKMPPRPVQTTFAVQRNAPIYIDSFGNLVPPQDVNIQAQVTGEIKEVHFTDGQEVKKGDLLFIIDPSPYQAELDKAKAAVAQDEAALKLAKDTLERNRQLVASNLISAQDFEKYETDVSDTEARLRLDQANVELAQINLGYCSINSPVDGLTGKCQVDAGNIVTANTGPILVTVKSIDTLYVDFTIPEKELGRVRAAMESNKLKVDVIVEGDPRGPYSGEVIFINNTVDNTTGTFAMRAAIDNKNRALWAGQFVHLHLILGTTEGAVLVPYEAVQLGQKGAYLFAVTADNKAEVRLVETGNRQGEEIVVKDGVKAGEKVVVSGQLGLSNGASVVDVAELKKQREKKKR